MKKSVFFIALVAISLVFFNVSALGKTGFFKEDGSLYYYKDGIVQKGITEIDGEDYFLGEYTGKVQVGFVTSSLTGDIYYTNQDGKIQKGFVSVGDATYYFDSDGKLVKGITNIDGEDYFLGEYTGKVQVGFVTSSLTGDRYYTDENGKILKGITNKDGEDYFLGENTGKIQVGFVQ